MEVTNIRNCDNKRKVYCTMELEGGEKLQTEPVPSNRATWETQADFQSNQVRPVMKVKLFQKSKNFISIEDKELGRVLIKPLPITPKCTEWYPLLTGKTGESNTQNVPRIKLAIRIDRPPNLKHCGYLYAQGKQAWKKWKMRFFALVQVSQYTFAMCSYQERKSEPHEMVQLDGFTVDYSESEPGLEGGESFFNAMKEGDTIIFSSADDEDRSLWVQALYRATGQSYKPIPPAAATPKQRHVEPSQPVAPPSATTNTDDKKGRVGLDEYSTADPCAFDHPDLFELLQRMTLLHRLNDQYACLGWFSPGQLFVLDEYCARYGVRLCHRHLCYINDLLEQAEKGAMIDPTLLHYCYAFISSHIYGSRPEGIVTVTLREIERFNVTKERLQSYLESQVANYRFAFPFGRPEGALKATLSLLERVMMKNLCTPVESDDIRTIITTNLDRAAKLNFAQVQQESHLEDKDDLSDPEIRLDELMHLAELCIEVTQQNEEYHSEGREAFQWFTEAMIDHNELFWYQFSVEMDNVLDIQPSDSWDSFPLFQLLNDFFNASKNLCLGRFHTHLMDVFAPMVIRYIDLMESSIGQSVHRGLERESWEPGRFGCQTSDEVLWKLDALQTFITDLNWPEKVFATHLQHRLKVMATDMIQSMTQRVLLKLEVEMKLVRPACDWALSTPTCVMINVITECQKRSVKLCSATEEMIKTGMKELDVDGVSAQLQQSLYSASDMLVDKFSKVLDGVLVKLSRYDEGTFSSTVLSFTKPTMETANEFIKFLRKQQDIIRDRVSNDDLIDSIFEDWYMTHLKQIHEWLKTRAGNALHIHQLKSLIKIFQKMYKDFELQGVLNTRQDPWKAVEQRLTVEEATASVTIGPLGDGISMKDSDTEE